jgi:hypothetical protein
VHYRTTWRPLVLSLVLEACGGGSGGSGEDARADRAPDAAGSAGSGGDARPEASGGGGFVYPLDARDAAAGAEAAPDVAAEAAPDVAAEAAPDVARDVSDDSVDAVEGGAAEAGVDGGSTTLVALSGRYAGMTQTYLCDVNGDGKVDIVAGPPRASFPAVWRGHGDGTFDATPIMTVANFAPPGYAIDVGDFDGDHMCDLFYMQGGPVQGTYGLQVAVAHGQSNGTFVTLSAAKMLLVPKLRAASYVHSKACDVDGDGLSDVVYAATSKFGDGYDFFVVRGQPAGSPFELAGVSSPTGTVAPGVSSVAGAADVDKDGKADVIVGSADGLFVVYGDGGGAFTGRRTLVAAAAQAGFLTDLDGDGRGDPVVDVQGTQRVYWAGASLAFTAGPTGVFEGSGDFDGDGRRDLVGGNVVVLNDGARGFGRAHTLPNALGGFLAGDFDADQATDVIAGNVVQGSAVYLSTAKHAASASPDVHCGTLAAAECNVVGSF